MGALKDLSKPPIPGSNLGDLEGASHGWGEFSPALAARTDGRRTGPGADRSPIDGCHTLRGLAKRIFHRISDGEQVTSSVRQPVTKLRGATRQGKRISRLRVSKICYGPFFADRIKNTNERDSKYLEGRMISTGARDV